MSADLQPSALAFTVRGSSGSHYQLRATGSGSDFFIRCSCPAFSRGGAFCKHAAAILMGELDALVVGTEHMPALRAASSGSRFMGMALSHVPAAPDRKQQVVDVASLAALQPLAAELIGHAAYRLELAPEELGGQRLSLVRLKTGRQRKDREVLSIRYVPMAREGLWDINGKWQETGIKQRAKPWSVQTIAYATLQRAAYVFLDAVRDELSAR
jgi:hypothetical protein